MRYAPDSFTHQFVGQHGYGYKSIESWVLACFQLLNDTYSNNINNNDNDMIKNKERKDAIREWNRKLSTLSTTKLVTAILEAGRRSLDAKGQWINLEELYC